MIEDGVLKMLFVEHHRQLSEIRQKIQSLTERVVGVLVLATGWLISIGDRPSPPLRVVVVLAVLLIASSAVVTLVRYNRNYRQVARVVAKINESFGFFDCGKFLPGGRIYPESWRGFGTEAWWRGILQHCAFILTISALCIAAAVVG
jgi:hypothetical protein